MTTTTNRAHKGLGTTWLLEGETPTPKEKKRRQIFKPMVESINFIYPVPIRSREMRSSSRLYLVLQKLQKVAEKSSKGFSVQCSLNLGLNSSTNSSLTMQFLIASGPSRTRNPSIPTTILLSVPQGTCKWNQDCRTNPETMAKTEGFSYISHL